MDFPAATVVNAHHNESGGEAGQLHDWFAERGLDLRFDPLDDEWVALALPQGAVAGAAASEHGATKLEAAERLRAKFAGEDLNQPNATSGGSDTR